VWVLCGGAGGCGGGLPGLWGADLGLVPGRAGRRAAVLARRGAANSAARLTVMTSTAESVVRAVDVQPQALIQAAELNPHRPRHLGRVSKVSCVAWLS
jgi:hypothetical protein